MNNEITTEEFTNEFKRISSEKILRDYELKNRDRISAASFEVRDAFDQLWIKITGTSYYQPSTVVKPQVFIDRNNTERTDPKGRNYRAKVTFTKICWQRLRRRISKKDIELYVLDGDTDGNRRPIFQNLDANRLKEILGDQNTEKILKERDNDHGELKGKFELLVEGYWEVVFAPASSHTDPKDVQLTWEGQCLIIQRMKEVVLPGFYLEVADNATKDNYIQTPEMGRKKVGIIQMFPYTTLREATRDEYLAQKASGDKAMEARRRRDESI